MQKTNMLAENHFKNFYKIKLDVVIAIIFLMAVLNMNSIVHDAIIHMDTTVALGMNSLIGIYPILDRTIACLSTRVGDACILFGIFVLLAYHSLHNANFWEFIQRSSYWSWVGCLCLITYVITCVPMFAVMRETPLLAFHDLKNLQIMYGYTFHSCPTNSFPSGHALAYIFFAMMAWKKYFRISLVLCFAATVMLSIRLMVGLHWLSDILGSVLLAMLLIALINDTPLKNTYKYFQQIILFVIIRLLIWYKRYFENFIFSVSRFN